MSQEQTPTSQPVEATGELGSLDAAALAFEKREQALNAEAETEVEAETEAETEDDDPDAEASDGDSDEDNAEPAGLVEVEYEGKSYKLPPELQKAVLRQADYSRNMNEVSQSRKTLAQRAEYVEVAIEGATKKAEALAGVRLIEHQLRQMEALDFNTIKQEDPARASLIGFEYLNAKQQLATAKAAADAIDGDVSKAREALAQSQRQEMFAAIKKEVPTWGDKDGQALTEWHLARGGSFEELASITDAKRILDMHKAMKYDKLQASKSELKAKTKEAPPVLKPGTRLAKQSPQDESMAQLRKFKTRDAAEVAFLARMR